MVDFEFTHDDVNIVLRIGQFFKKIDEFRKVVKVFEIKNGFRLKRVKNENNSVTLNCAALRCTWRIHANLNWIKNIFRSRLTCLSILVRQTMRIIKKTQHGLQPHSSIYSKLTHNSLLMCLAPNFLETIR